MMKSAVQRWQADAHFSGKSDIRGLAVAAGELLKANKNVVAAGIWLDDADESQEPALLVDFNLCRQEYSLDVLGVLAGQKVGASKTWLLNRPEFEIVLDDENESIVLTETTYVFLKRTAHDIELIACVSVSSSTSDSLTDSLRNLIGALAFALDRLVQTTCLDLMRKVSHLSNSAKSRREFLTDVSRLVSSILGAGGCSIFVFDALRQRLQLEGTTGIVSPANLEPLDCVFYQLGEGLTGLIAQRESSLRLRDATNESECERVGVGEEMATKSCEVHLNSKDPRRPFLGAPILRLASDGSQCRLVGVIRLSQRLDSTVEQFTAFESLVLREICELLASCILRWNDETTNQELRANIDQLLSSLHSLHSGDEYDIDSLLLGVCETARSILGAKVSTIMLHKPALKMIVGNTCAGKPDRGFLGLELRYGQGLSGWCAQHRKTKALQNTENPVGVSYYPVWPDIRSELSTPILFGVDLLGVLTVSSDIPEFFVDDETVHFRLIESLASQAAIAIHRAEVLAEREEWRGHLVRTTRMLESSSIAIGIAHELKNSLAAADALIDTLANSKSVWAGTVPAGVGEVEERICVMQNLVGRVLDLSKADDLLLESVSINTIVEDCVDYLSKLASIRKLKLDAKYESKLAQEKFFVRVDKRQIALIFGNIVMNAIDASHSRQTIEVRTYYENGFACVSVKDYGTGISDADKPKVFQLFGTTKPHGYGVGMHVAKMIVQRHSGRIDFTTKRSVGTEFTVHLPIESNNKK